MPEDDAAAQQVFQLVRQAVVALSPADQANVMVNLVAWFMLSMKPHRRDDAWEALEDGVRQCIQSQVRH